MPVTDLREYLQLPQAAPQNPGFQRTRQLAGMPTEPFQSALAFERAAPGIRANQGLAYLQEIQNHQNEIAQQAQNIRIQQEAQLAAEQATQGLAGANPQSTGWLPQRQQILQQNPNAMLDPRFQNALRIYDQGYSQFDHQRQLQQRQIDAENKQLQGLMLRGMEYGGDEEKLTKFAQARDLGGMAQVVGEARRANLGKSKTGKDKIDYRTKGLFDKYASALAGGNPEEAKAISDYAREQGLHWENPVAQDASGSAVMAPPAPISPEVQAVQNVALSKIPYAQQEQYVKELEAKAGEQAAVNKAWNDAQLELESKLEKVIGTGNIGNTNYSKLRAFAQAVANDERVPLPYNEGDGVRATPFAWKKALNDMGVDITKKLPAAFTEPGDKRKMGPFGSQDVPYEQLFKSWAENYLKTSPVTIASQAPALPAKKASVLDSLLDSSMKPTQ